MDFDKEGRNIEKIYKKLNISDKMLNTQLYPLQAIYAICDHLRTILFAVTDGGIPSNIGGGYNLRVLLRRVFSFEDKYKFIHQKDPIVMIGNGFNDAWDEVYLKNASSLIIDSMSYGNVTTIFPTPPGAPAANQSLARSPNGTDTDTAADWVIDTSPSLGTAN